MNLKMMTRPMMFSASVALVCLGQITQAQETTDPAVKPAETPAVTPQEAPKYEPREDLPSSEEIIKKSVDAMGGLEAMEKIQSTQAKATLTTPMGAMTLEMYTAKTDKFLLKQGMPNIGETSVGSDGTVGWMSNPMTGMYQLLEDEQMEQMKGQTDMHMMLARVQEEYETIHTIDLVDFDGASCHKLILIDEDLEEGEPQNHPFIYFNEETHLLAGMEMNEQGMGQSGSTSIMFKDWKEIGDIKFFHKMIINQMGMPLEMNYTLIELNNVDESIFELPEEVKKLVAERESAKSASEPDAEPADSE